MSESLPNSGRNERAGSSDPFGFGALELSGGPESQVRTPEYDKQKSDLIQEINEQIPFLAYGLSEKIRQNGLGGKVSVRGIMGSAWGVGVSKNNPRKDIPNIVVYPENILSESRAVTNAQLRHEIGNLNHSIDHEMFELSTWCERHGQPYQLMAPLVEAVQEASVNYLEMRNSISDDPAAAFRPLYDKIIPIRDIAENIGSGLEYKQAVDMTLLKSLHVAGLVDQETLENANSRLSVDVGRAFSGKTDSIIKQAVRTSSGKVKVQLVKDYLWPEFSQFIPQAEDSPAVNDHQLAERSEHDLDALTAQKALDILQRNQDLSPEEQSERFAANTSLSEAIQNKIDQLSNQLSSSSSETQDAGSEQSQNEDVRAQLENLQSLLDDLKNPEKASGDDLENLQFKIHEVGINESELDDRQLELLNHLREFCQTTTVAYVRTMRFIMEAYQSYNPNFTDAMMEKMIRGGHDTPSFTIYGKTAGEDFIQNTCSELGYENFASNGMVLNFNLPDVLGRFWYRGGVGAKAQPVPEGAIEWGHFYRSGMPAIWKSVDAAPMNGLYLDRLNAFGQHDFRKYYYLYDVMGFDLPPEDQPEPESESESEPESGTGVDRQGDALGSSGTSLESEMSDDSSDVEVDTGDLQAQLSELLDDLDSLENEPSDSDSRAFEQALADLVDKNNGSSDHSDMDQPGAESLSQEELSELFGQLQATQEKLENAFSKSMSGQDSYQEYDIDDQDIEPDTVESIDNLEAIKELQQRQLETVYHEQTGLSGEALDKYIFYREEMRFFTDDLISYFTEKFKLDTEYTYINNQRRGNRLQRGWTSRILGRTALGVTAIEPEIFERKSVPKKPQFVWSVIIDNSSSCDGETIEEEKKTAIALTEVARRLDIPLEIVTFGGSEEYVFLKTFDQELYGDQLAELVRLEANQSTPDVVTLNAACSSVSDYADSFNRSYNFVYFMTDGESSSGSIQSVIQKFQRDMVITGIGLAEAADSIAQTWGRNSIGVKDVNDLSDTLIRKIENQIEETF